MTNKNQAAYTYAHCSNAETVVAMTSPDAAQVLLDHYEACYNRYGDCARGVDWPNRDDADVRYRVMLAPALAAGHRSVHDYGCGLGHLYEYLHRAGLADRFDYSGSDGSALFVDACRHKFPDVNFDQLNVTEPDFEPRRYGAKYEHIIANGVFTEKRELDFDAMWAYTRQALLRLFDMCSECLSVNFMSIHVDYERDDLFHLPADTLLEFCRRNLTRHVTLVADYGLYEYTARIYKNPQT